MSTTCLFTITGFFAVTAGNRDNARNHACYESAIACTNSPSIPAQLYIFNPASPALYPDNTIVWILGKAYYPPPGDCTPAVINAVECAPLPGDPTSDSYISGMPDFRQPAVTLAGIVSSGPQPVDEGAVEFLLTTQDYVRGCARTSTIMYVPDACHPSPFVYFLCRPA
jgi:hypothetical protein